MPRNKKPKRRKFYFRSRAGHRNENKIEKILRERRSLDGGRVFLEVIHHAKHSKEDSNGMDFSVSRMMFGKIIWKSFGVTISKVSRYRSRKKHKDIPCFYTPVGFDRGKFMESVLLLFS